MKKKEDNLSTCGPKDLEATRTKPNGVLNTRKIKKIKK